MCVICLTGLYRQELESQFNTFFWNQHFIWHHLNYVLKLPENKPCVVFEILCDSELTSCRLLHLSFTSKRANKRLPKSLTHMKISCWFPYSIRGQIEKGGLEEEPLWKTTWAKKKGKESGEHVSPRAFGRQMKKRHQTGDQQGNKSES